MTPEQHIPTTEAIKAIKEVSQLITKLNKCRSLAKKVHAAAAEGRITADRATELLGTLRNQATYLATGIAQAAFFIGQGDDCDRQLLGEQIAETMVG